MKILIGLIIIGIVAIIVASIKKKPSQKEFPVTGTPVNENLRYDGFALGPFTEDVKESI